MDKKVANKLKEQKMKKKWREKSKKVEGTQFTQVKWTTQRRLIKKEDIN